MDRGRCARNRTWNAEHPGHPRRPCPGCYRPVMKARRTNRARKEGEPLTESRSRGSFFISIWRRIGSHALVRMRIVAAILPRSVLQVIRLSEKSCRPARRERAPSLNAASLRSLSIVIDGPQNHPDPGLILVRRHLTRRNRLAGVQEDAEIFTLATDGHPAPSVDNAS